MNFNLVNYLYLFKLLLLNQNTPDSLFFWQSDKRLFFSCTTRICTVFVLFNWFALYLPCALCHFTLFFLFLTMSSFVYLYSLYVHMVKLYLSVFERLLSVFNVNCMHQGSESKSNFNSLYVCTVHVEELTIKQTWLDPNCSFIDITWNAPKKKIWKKKWIYQFLAN